LVAGVGVEPTEACL